MKKHLLGATVLLLLCSHIVRADEIRLTSSSTKSIDLSVVTSTATAVTVDWGDGNSVSTDIAQTDINGTPTVISGIPVGEVILKGNGITLFDCSFGSVTAINLASAPNLIKLSVNNNSLAALDLSANTALYSLHVETNPALTALNLSNNTALELLYCYDNNMTSLDVTANTKLTTLNFNNNKLMNIDLSHNTALKSIYAVNNQFETIDLSKNVNLTYVSLNTNKLKTIDVSALIALKSLFLLNNNLTEIKGANTVAKNGTVNCAGNKLTLATLPQPEALKSTFTYAPQQAMPILTSIKVGESLDLSAQNNVKGILASAVATTYAWTTKSGKALVAKTDYEENGGVFTFLLPQSETVICTMSTTAFPKFTGTATFKTTEMSVLAAGGTTGLAQLEDVKVNVYPNPVTDRLLVSSDFKINNLEIYNTQGMLVWSTKADAVRVEVPTENLHSGVYVVRVATEKGLSAQRCIVRK